MSLNIDMLKPSASMEVSRIMNELKLKGQKVYSLSIGDTHFSPPDCIINKLNALPPEFSHYSGSLGLSKLRAQIAETVPGYHPDEVIIVPGLKQGLYYLLSLMSNQRVCILEPAWLGYQATAIMTECDTVSINMNSDNWLTSLQEERFDTIILCSPNNPDGKIFSENEIDLIMAAVIKNNAWVILDLIYDRFDYTGGGKLVTDKFKEYKKGIICNGFSKSHAMTGFRIGYIMTKDKELIAKIDLIQQNLSTCVNTISQYLLLDFKEANNCINEYVAYYKSNRDIVVSFFPEWEAYKPDGGFYFFIDLLQYGIHDANKFCKDLLEQTGVALIAGSAYGNGFDSFVRLSFSIERDQLTEALNILKIRIKNEKN